MIYTLFVTNSLYLKQYHECKTVQLIFRGVHKGAPHLQQNIPLTSSGTKINLLQILFSHQPICMLFCSCPYVNSELGVTIISNIDSTGLPFQPQTRFQWLALSKSHPKNCCYFHVFKTNFPWMSFSFSYVTLQLQQVFICNFICCLCSAPFLCSRIWLLESEKAVSKSQRCEEKRH